MRRSVERSYLEIQLITLQEKQMLFCAEQAASQRPLWVRGSPASCLLCRPAAQSC